MDIVLEVFATWFAVNLLFVGAALGGAYVVDVRERRDVRARRVLRLVRTPPAEGLPLPDAPTSSGA